MRNKIILTIIVNLALTFGLAASARAQTTGYKDMVLVTIHYVSSHGIGIPTAKVSQATYCGQPLGPVGTRIQANNQYVTEMWYRMSPQAGNCEVKVLFVDAYGNPADPGHRVASATIFHNVNETSPIASTFTKVFSGPFSASPNRIDLSGTGPKDTVMMCAITGYPNGGYNVITPVVPRNQFWSHNGKIDGVYRNVLAALGVTFTRTSENQNMTLSWTTTQSMPWSALCANFRSKPFTTLSPTPTPFASPKPTPTPTLAPLTVDLKVNGSNGPVSVVKGATVNLSWTSTGATSCTASGAWSGAKAVNGTAVSTAVTSNRTFSLTCYRGTLSRSDSVYVTTLTLVPPAYTSFTPLSTQVVTTTTTPTLSWLAVVPTSTIAKPTTYHLQMARDSLFTQLTVIKADVAAPVTPTSSTRVNYLATVPEGSVRYWRVRSGISSLGLYGSWSGTGILKVAFKTAPTLLAFNKTSSQGTAPVPWTFKWKAIGETTQYIMQRRTVYAGNTIPIPTPGPWVSYSVTNATIAKDGMVYWNVTKPTGNFEWRVAARNAALGTTYQYGPYSSILKEIQVY